MSKNGIYFSKRDYAGFWRRVVIIAVDGCVIFLAAVMIESSLEGLSLDWNETRRIFWAIFLFCFFAYVVEIKRRWGTLGNLITKTKLVNLEGNRPSCYSMTIRAIFWMFGPIIFIVDLFWLTDNPDRQMIRDKMSGIYVIKRDSQPSGSGVIGSEALFILGYGLVFRHVRRHSKNSRLK